MSALARAFHLFVRIGPILLLCSACAVPSFHPIAPHTAREQGLRVTLTKLDFASATNLVVTAELEGAPGTRVRRAVLAPAKALPCREGIREQRWFLDGKSVWLRPAKVEGAHVALLQYSDGAWHDILREGAAIDFVVASDDPEASERDEEDDQCVRVMLNGNDPALAWHAESSHGVAGASLRVYSPSAALGGVGAGWAFVDSVGAYLGPLRLQGDAGFGTANCRRDCLDSGLAFVWFPLGASTHVYVLDHHGAGIDLGLGYRWFFSSVGGEAGSRSVTLGGPELTLRLSGTASLGRGIEGGSRIVSSGLEFIASNWRYNGPAGRESALVLGLALTWDHGF